MITTASAADSLAVIFTEPPVLTRSKSCPAAPVIATSIPVQVTVTLSATFSPAVIFTLPDVQTKSRSFAAAPAAVTTIPPAEVN